MAVVVVVIAVVVVVVGSISSGSHPPSKPLELKGYERLPVYPLTLRITL